MHVIHDKEYIDIKAADNVNQKTIIIAGSGRSGTTWVQDSIAEANGLRTIFEPLHPIGVPAAQEFTHKYCEVNTNNRDLKLFMDKVLSGNYRSLWMNYRIRPDRFNFFREGIPNAVYNTRKLLQHYKKYSVQGQHGLIVKFIRASLMLPWLVRQYNVRALYVTRHPCAVIASRLSLGGKDWTSKLALDRYRADPVVVQLIQHEFGVDITDWFSPIAALTCVWCIENLLPIKWANEAGYMVTAYEKLLLEPEREWGRVIGGLGLLHVPDTDLREKPSQQVSMKMQGKVFSESHLGKWRQNLTSDQINEISSVLDLFSCSIYSVDEDGAIDT